MDEKTKLFVFTRLEVFLFFIFVILIAATSLIVGFNIGKKHSLLRDGFTLEDQQKIELMSSQEEMVEKVVNEKDATAPESKDKVLNKTYSKLAEEFNKLDKADQKAAKEQALKDEFAGKQKKGKMQEGRVDPKIINSKSVAVDKKTLEVLRKKDDLSGKFTIQLGSYRSIRVAEDFADGFRVRGYNPIINEVTLKSGTWYRVSLGVFDNIGQTKDYINKEKSLLRGTDYVIVRFD